MTGTVVDADAHEAQARASISALDAHHDDEGVARAWFVLATTYWVRARWDDMREPLSRSIAYAERAGNRSMELEALVHDLAAVAFGSTPVDEGIRVARQVLEDVSDSRELQGWAIRFIGTFLALEGRVAEGRELLEQARAIFTELGNGEALVALAFSMGPLELRAGNPVAAEREFRTALESAQRMGDRGRLTNLASGLADALLDQGRIDDAAEYVDLARDTARERRRERARRLANGGSAPAAWSWRDRRGNSARARVDLVHGVQPGASHPSRPGPSPGRGLPGREP